jgi:ubiquinol oxidase
MAFEQNYQTGVQLELRHTPRDGSDRVAYALTKMLRFLADTFFRKRY